MISLCPQRRTLSRRLICREFIRWDTQKNNFRNCYNRGLFQSRRVRHAVAPTFFGAIHSRIGVFDERAGILVFRR